MTCVECQDYLNARLDERRQSLATLHVADHLAACRACRELYSLSESSWSGTAASPFHGAPDGFAERVLNRAGAERRRRDRTWSWVALSLLLALPVGLAGAAFFAADSYRDGPRLVEKEKGKPKLPIAQLLKQSDRLRAMPQEGFDFAINLAGKAGDSAAKLLPDFGQLPTGMDNPMTAFRPVRHLGQTLSHAMEPVSTSAGKAYAQVRQLVPAGKPKRKTPPV